MKNDFMSDVRKNLKERFGKNKNETQKGKFFGDSSKGFVNMFGINENIKKLHAEAKIPRPLMIDEVAFAFVAGVRVNCWDVLGEEFGGYKQGRLWAYILSILNERIEDSTAATIRVDVPLYEQCPTVCLKNTNLRVEQLEQTLARIASIIDEDKLIPVSENPIVQNRREMNVFKNKLKEISEIIAKALKGDENV